MDSVDIKTRLKGMGVSEAVEMIKSAVEMPETIAGSEGDIRELAVAVEMVLRPVEKKYPTYGPVQEAAIETRRRWLTALGINPETLQIESL